MVRYARPNSTDGALALLAEGGWKLFAGGTDFYPALGSLPLKHSIIDLNGVAELRGIAETDAHFVIGARTTWTDICRADLPPAFDALKQAAREVGSVQIQNTGTVAGNLCNASPAADGVPALMVLDAEVELRSQGGIRRLPLQDFILGNRRTALAGSELVTAIRVPKASTAGRSIFYKLGTRRYLVISIAMAAVRLEVASDHRIAAAAVAVGACSAVAQRLHELEADLIGLAADADFGSHVRLEHFSSLTPIDDVRGSADYRRAAAREIVVRALAAARAAPAGEAAA
ncbi:FAD binding domain-containing protein [Arvimicrobium flavum]|uniref:FAD binding domain-containing protein n=1 Tax=Arvimicrobium flavum TaxID=3393320 RepID=UPI00237BEF3A|nr:FAD binding domain-containing protein [Mesorhizobium shangrilense]